MYRLLALDLDGTLLDPKREITPRTHEALRRAVEAGVTLVIATGQTFPALLSLCPGVPLNGPQIVYNGAIIADIADGSPLYEQLVPVEYILPTLGALQEQDIFRVYHTHESVFADAGTPGARNWYRPPAPTAVEVQDVAELYPRPCIKLVGVCDPTELARKRVYFEELFASQLYVTQAASDLIEFLHPEVSKGRALLKIAGMLGISSTEIAAIGDNHNDIDMLRFSGLGIAMGNASEEVKAAAHYVTLSNAEDGVALAIEEQILPFITSA